MKINFTILSVASQVFSFLMYPSVSVTVKQKFHSELDSIHILAFLSSANQHPSCGPIAGTISVSAQESKVSLFTSIFHTYMIWHFSLLIAFYFYFNGHYNWPSVTNIILWKGQRALSESRVILFCS